MAGTIGKDLSIMAGNIQLSGTVHGDVLLEGGEIQIHEGTVIDGSLLVTLTWSPQGDQRGAIKGQLYSLNGIPMWGDEPVTLGLARMMPVTIGKLARDFDAG